MSAPINDGGPAYHSITRINGDNYNPPRLQYHKGMSLRDWFAGQALQHIPLLLDAHEKNKAVEVIANWAYAVADAMIAARKGGAA